MLFSDTNLEKAMKGGVLEVIMYILDPANTYTIEEKKGALKCTLPCSRFSSTVNIVILRVWEILNKILLIGIWIEEESKDNYWIIDETMGFRCIVYFDKFPC